MTCRANLSLRALMGAAMFASASAFAADNYYFQDAQGDHDLANPANWTKNDQTTVPSALPAIDTATGGSTHPLMNITKSGTLALPNADSLTLQDLEFQTANTVTTIDLGSKDKTLKLFGEGNAALWVGGNWPNNQRVTLKSGVLTRVQSSQRNTAIRLGGQTGSSSPARFTVDGPDACVSNLTVTIDAPNSVFCVTNGGKAYFTGNYPIRINQRVKDGCVRVSGEGSLLKHADMSKTGFLFGDNITNPEKKSGRFEVTDSGAVSGLSGTLGNRAGNFTLLVDHASWTNSQFLTLGNLETSTNNVLTVRNQSTVKLSGTLAVGNYGGYNRAEVLNSTLSAASLKVGARNIGAGYNEMTVSNSTFTVSTDVYVGGSAADAGSSANAYNNTLRIIDSTADGAAPTWYLGYLAGGTNHLYIANSSARGGFNLGRGGAGHNLLTITNCTAVRGTVTLGCYQGDGTREGSSGNVARLVDSTFGSSDLTTTATFSLGYGQKTVRCDSNRVEIVRSTWYNSGSSLGIGGYNMSAGVAGGDGNALVVDDHSTVVAGSGTTMVGGYGYGNRLEVRDGSTFAGGSISLAREVVPGERAGTNVLYVGKNASVTLTGLVRACPGGNIVEIEDGTFRARLLQTHYVWSAAQKKTIDSLTGAEEEYGLTGFQIWGTRFILKGQHPVIRFPDDDSLSGSGVSGLSFDRAVSLEYELPAQAYAQAPVSSALSVSFANGTNYRFDFTNVPEGVGRIEYPIASVDGTGTLTIPNAEFTRLSGIVADSAAAQGCRATLVKSNDGKTLRIRASRPARGMILLFR